MPDPISIGRATTGWPALDEVLCGLEPGDNVVWGVERIEDYRRLVEPYERAAEQQGLRRIYFRFGRHEPLLEEKPGLEIYQFDPTRGFESFVRDVHRVIESCGPGTIYIFDLLSDLAEAWHSDQAVGNFFVLTCPRLLALRTVTYFAITRDAHSATAMNPIRETTQFLLDVFSVDDKCYIRPLKVQYRSRKVMNTVHVQDGERLLPVEESAILARILSRTRWPSLHRRDEGGFWNRLFREVERLLVEKKTGTLTPEAEEVILRQVRAAFRVHRSGIASLAESFLTLEDFWEIRKRQIGVGSIGGKALGMLVARAIVRSREPELSDRFEVHDSFFVGAEVFVTYLVRNGVWWIRESQQQPEGFLKHLQDGRDHILAGEFPPKIVRQFEGLLDYFGEMPCIVRSSSILEDARGNAFSGKYESIFLTNRGSRAERLTALIDAIRRVYASVLDPEALRYRKARNLLDSEERMALLIMRVSGRRRGGYFFPQAAGVGLSYNPYRWHPEIDPEAGVVRLVFGLGTRAVDRNDDDYTRLVALNTPLRRPEASVDEQIDHSQRKVDVLDLDARELVSLPVETLTPVCADFPADLFLENSPNGLPWLTFRKLLRDTPVAEDLRRMLGVLADAYQHPVDVEFAINFLPDGSYRIHLLQCRTFQIQKNPGEGGNDPSNLPGRRILECRGAVIGIGRESQVHDILHVPAHLYAALGEQDRHQVAKLIETLVQRHDPERNLLLLGPGRWGTSCPSLGVPVRAGRIATASAVCEIMAMHGGLIPDVSLGTHFFNDLVEHELLYMACFPGKPGNSFDEAWLMAAPNQTEVRLEKLGKTDRFTEVARWLDVADLDLTLTADPFHQVAILRLP
jgi:pyruvate,water dikinase